MVKLWSKSLRVKYIPLLVGEDQDPSCRSPTFQVPRVPSSVPPESAWTSRQYDCKEHSINASEGQQFLQL